MEIKIEKGIEIPSKKGKYNKYPFGQMEVGDSFFVPIKEGGNMRSFQPQISSLAKSYSLRNKNNEWEFTVRQEGVGVRGWRIA